MVNGRIMVFNVWDMIMIRMGLVLKMGMIKFKSEMLKINNLNFINVILWGIFE